MIKKLIIVLLPLLIVNPSFSEVLHITESGSGTQDGSDWNNALSAFPTLRSDNVYYISDGSYPEIRIREPNITIKKAVPTDHGSDIGWNNEMGDGEALINGRIVVSAGNLIVDGQRKDSMTSGYGIRIDATSGRGIFFNNDDADDCKFSYIDIFGRGPDGNSTANGLVANDCVYTVRDVDRVSFHHCYMHDSGRTFILIRKSDFWLWEYCRFERNESDAGEHSAGFSCGDVGGVGSDDCILRYCQFVDVDGTANVLLNNCDRWKIHGNVHWDTVPNDETNCGSAGVIGHWNGSPTRDVAAHGNLIYNNTYYNLEDAAGGTGIKLNHPAVNTGNVVVNNMWIGCENIWMNGVEIHDYNYYYDNTNTSIDEPNIENGTSLILNDPINEDFTLLAATLSGDETVGSGLNHDAKGNTRGSDGIWDRGAFEFSDFTSVPEPTPMIIKATKGDILLIEIQ